MGAGKRGKHQLTHIGVAHRNGHPGGALIYLADAVDIVQIKAGVNRLGVHIQRDGNDVHIAGPFTVAEKSTFDSVRPGK